MKTFSVAFVSAKDINNMKPESGIITKLSEEITSKIESAVPDSTAVIVCARMADHSDIDDVVEIVSGLIRKSNFTK